MTADGHAALSGDGGSCRFVISRKTLIVDRMVGGLTCRISLPAAFYGGVALMMGENDSGERTYGVQLMHNDPGLTMTIPDLAGLGPALDLRDDLARQLRLPALAVSCDGEISGDVRKLGGVIAGPEIDRRGSMATRRRPRFLARRKKGQGRTARRLGGREIIARD